MRVLALILIAIVASVGHAANQAPRPPQAPPVMGCADAVQPATYRIIHDGVAYDVPAGCKLVWPGQPGYATAAPAQRSPQQPLAQPMFLPPIDGGGSSGNCRR